MRGLLVGAAVPRRRVDSAQPVPFEPSAILKEVLEVMPLIFFIYLFFFLKGEERNGECALTQKELCED